MYTKVLPTYIHVKLTLPQMVEIWKELYFVVEKHSVNHVTTILSDTRPPGLEHFGDGRYGVLYTRMSKGICGSCDVGYIHSQLMQMRARGQSFILEDTLQIRTKIIIWSLLRYFINRRWNLQSKATSHHAFRP